MSTQVNGSTGTPGESSESGKAKGVSGSPAQLEQEIQARRDHLASTIDELTNRAKPKEVARRSAIGVQRKLQSFTHTPDGQLRSERLGAIGGAVLVIAGVMVFIRRRR
jgi:hypothetical protein